MRARHVLNAGERAYCALTWAERFLAPQNVEEADAKIAATTRYWRRWLGQARIPDHAWRDPLQRSALAIKGLTYMPTGATVAALTTSLPETPGGERNWDYRYTWMRDATFTLQALHFLNLDWEADEFMQFVADLETNEDGSLQIMYGIDGRLDLTESTRDDLSGYAGARPVRIGNGAFDQRQNDVFGAVLDSFYLHTRRSGRLPRRLWPIVKTQAECAIAVWRNPDQGIWEARGAPQHYVSSKLMSWVALDRAAKLADLRGDPELGSTWRETAEEIKQDILDHGLTDAGVLRQHYETDSLDASNLLAAIFGFLPGDDTRLRASVEAIANDLTEHGFVLRYRTDETDDGLSGKEGTFLICSFWLVSALAIVGEQQRARDLMERLLRVASPLGLYAEEFDADTGTAPGQLPAGVLAPGADRGGGADHLGRATGGGGRLMDSYDVVIIGTGAGGGTLARHLAPSGKRILLLERGDWLPREPQNWLSRERVRRQPLHLARHLVRRARQGVPAADPLLRRRRDEALRRRALPLPQGGLRRADATTTASRPRGRSRTTSSSRTTRSPSRCTRCTARAARTRPSRPRARRTRSLRSRTSRASSSSPTTSPPPATTRSTRRAGSCSTRRTCRTARACAAGTATASRASCMRSRTRRCSACGRRSSIRTSRCWTNARAVKLETDESGRNVTEVVVEHDGGTERVAGDVVVVSCGAANSAKLLLESANDRHPNGLANGSDQVGRNYMFHASQAVLALSRDANPTVFQKTLALNDFYFSGGPDADYPLGNIQMVGKSQAPMFRGEKPRETKLAPHWTLERIATPRDRLLALDRGPPAAREPRHRRPRRQADARLQADERRAEGEAPAHAQVDARQARHERTTT